MGEERGDSACQLSLAGWYMTGVDNVLEKDEKRALELSILAAENDLPRAQYAVGI